MTVIAAWWTPTAGAIAADTLYQHAAGLGGLQVAGEPKINKFRHALVGVTGASMLTECLRGALATCASFPELRVAVMEHRQRMKAFGHGEVVSGLWTLDETAIVVLSSGLYTVFGDGGIMYAPPAGGNAYAAIGFGRDQAYGAMYAQQVHRVGSPEACVVWAVRAAQAHAIGCGGVEVSMLTMAWARLDPASHQPPPEAVSQGA